jgi:2-oxoglutarate ferredoxin oxidoreductase subunit alpha
MQEFLGLAYFAEIPVVLFDAQRGSPSTGMPTRTQQADLLSCAYASHGDTKHVMLLPEDPTESFAFAAQAFDLADRLQTPIFVMLDLDIGMQDWLCEPFVWDDDRRMDRGKIMTAADLDSGRDFGRYLDVDGDGIRFAPTRGRIRRRAAISRAAHGDRYARYTEEGGAYVDNMQQAAAQSSRPRRRWFPACDPQGLAADEKRRHLVRLDRRGHGRVARGARARRDPPRPDAPARVPVCRRSARVHRGARSHLRG